MFEMSHADLKQRRAERLRRRGIPVLTQQAKLCRFALLRQCHQHSIILTAKSALMSLVPHFDVLKTPDAA